MNKPELLAPAGSLKHVTTALTYGADAVYAGIPKWSLRVRGNGFEREDFQKGIEFAHSLGKKFFAVLNVIPHVRRTSGTSSFYQDLDDVASLKPDAFIMADPGLIDAALERHPEIDVHLSVQANTVNALTVKFWQKLGVKRCILARELSLNEIEMIRNECPDMELEVFVHGALCIAVSGRCLISGLLARRDANLGACNNSCRWNYKVRNLSCEIEETSKRQGEWMGLEEDENGSYLLNSKDLCALPLVKRLMDIGVDSLKIEGRSRSPLYCGAISRAYRLAIDALAEGKEIPRESFEIVKSLPSRAYTTGLLEPHRADETQDYETNSPSPGLWQICAQIEKVENGRLYLAVKNRFAKDSQVVLYTKNGPIALDLSSMQDKKGQSVEVAPGDGYFVNIKAPNLEGVSLENSYVLRVDPA